MTTPSHTRRRPRVWSAALALLGIVGVWALWLRPVDAQQLLGVALPASTSELQVALERRFPGEFEGYVRFSAEPAEVEHLLRQPFFTQRPALGNPLTVFDNAQRGSTPMNQIVERARPAWWRLPAHGQYIAAYRTFTGPNDGFVGPDASWYIIDTSDPQHWVVYVYVVEV
jgi:hypothetical protein